MIKKKKNPKTAGVSFLVLKPEPEAVLQEPEPGLDQTRRDVTGWSDRWGGVRDSGFLSWRCRDLLPGVFAALRRRRRGAGAALLPRWPPRSRGLREGRGRGKHVSCTCPALIWVIIWRFSQIRSRRMNNESAQRRCPLSLFC